MKINSKFMTVCTLAGALGLAVSTSIACAEDSKSVDPKPPEKPKDAWNVTLSLGVSVTTGNSDTSLYTADGLGVKKWDQNELMLHAFGSYGENEGDQNVGNAGFSAQFNRMFGERWYAYGRFSAFEDSISDIDYRFTVGAGAGYYFIKNDKTFLNGEVGPGYVWQKLGGVTDDFFTIRFAENFEYKFSKTAKIWQGVEYLPEVEDFGNYILNAVVGVEAGIYGNLRLQVKAMDTYQSRPAAGREKNDLQLTAGLAYTF